MSNRTRAFRRHHRQRVIKAEFRKRWVSAYLSIYDSTEELKEQRTFLMNEAIRAARTATSCSCYNCSSSRRLLGNTKLSRTRQERHAIADLRKDQY